MLVLNFPFFPFIPWTKTYLLPNCAGRKGLSRAVVPFKHFICAQWKNFNCFCYTWSLEEAGSSWSIMILGKLVFQSLLFLQNVSNRQWSNSLPRSSCWGPVSDAALYLPNGECLIFLCDYKFETRELNINHLPHSQCQCVSELDFQLFVIIA